MRTIRHFDVQSWLFGFHQSSMLINKTCVGLERLGHVWELGTVWARVGYLQSMLFLPSRKRLILINSITYSDRICSFHSSIFFTWLTRNFYDASFSFNWWQNQDDTNKCKQPVWNNSPVTCSGAKHIQISLVIPSAITLCILRP